MNGRIVRLMKTERPRLDRESALALWKRHQAGETQAALGKELGVTRQAVNAMFARYRFARLATEVNQRRGG